MIEEEFKGGGSSSKLIHQTNDKRVTSMQERNPGQRHKLGLGDNTQLV